MTVQVTLVSTESVWMALIVTVVSAHQDSQVTPFLLGPSFSPITLGKGHLKENHFLNVSYFFASWKVRSMILYFSGLVFYL